MTHTYQVIEPVTAIRTQADERAEQATQLLAGEGFIVEREEAGFGYGHSTLDQYWGWVHMRALDKTLLIPTHTVKTLRTYAYSKPNIKSAPVGLLSLNAKISGARRQGRFIEAQRLGWVIADHLRPVGDESEKDWVEVAERFIGTPYLWGGKDSMGLDCSGLIQMAMEAAGINIPRDSVDQLAWAKTHWKPIHIEGEFSGLKRGDLVFWPGHVGVMKNTEELLHANGHHMATIKERLDRAAKRIEFNYAPLTGIYRDLT